MYRDKLYYPLTGIGPDAESNPATLLSQSVITTLLPTEHIVHIYTLGLR
jgi:hypothetical protein